MARKLAFIGVLALLMVVASCSSGSTSKAPEATQPDQRGGVSPVALPRGAESVRLDPANFVPRITNLYLPLTPGTTWFYRGVDSDGKAEKIEFTVTDMTKNILGINATVVRDIVTVDGQVIEDTLDWFAQDRSGAVWYLGEEVRDYENGKLVSTAGSWEAGVDGAQPGIVMPADPKVGMAYRQEYYKGQAEDAARVLSVQEKVKVPFGAFGDVIMTKDTTPLEPGMVEHKYYAKGIGQVLSVPVSGAAGRGELVKITR